VAVSIAAELIAARTGRSGRHLSGSGNTEQESGSLSTKATVGL
jgi:xanthine/CO dehydrogenase XdhC/CoxF family maturation factor